MSSLKNLSYWTGNQMSRRSALRLFSGAAAALAAAFVPVGVLAKSSTNAGTAARRGRFFALTESGQPTPSSPLHCCPLYSCVLVGCDDCSSCSYDPQTGQCGNLYLCTDECTGEQHYECTILLDCPGNHYCNCNYGYC